MLFAILLFIKPTIIKMLKLGNWQVYVFIFWHSTVVNCQNINKICQQVNF